MHKYDVLGIEDTVYIFIVQLPLYPEQSFLNVCAFKAQVSMIRKHNIHRL